MDTRLPAPHPFVYTVLYVPFGALSGFVGVALTFLATRSGLSVTEGALLTGASMLTAWLKWIWAPIVDVTWTPKKWYVFSTLCSALGVFAMAVIPLGPSTLPLLLSVIAVASLINSMVGMSIEAIMAQTTAPGQEGRVSAWFQAGNLGGAGIGGALGLLLLETLPEPWMAGAIMASLFLSCCGGLLFVPNVLPHRVLGGPVAAVQAVIRDLVALFRTRGGQLAGLLCFMPIGTGAAQGVLTQASIAGAWGAGAGAVGMTQGLLSGFITAGGCFVGGWLCDRMHPQAAYARIGALLAVIAVAMAACPPWVLPDYGLHKQVFGYDVLAWLNNFPMGYVGFSLVYAAAVGLAYAAFTAIVLNAIGTGSAATKYSFFASLSNFPLWWLGLLLSRVADVDAPGLLGDWSRGPTAMLVVEASLGLAGIGIFALAYRRLGLQRAA